MTATIERLDHLNLRTAQLDAMIDWYQQVLGLKLGPRPDFDFPGAWLYAGEYALVHLVGIKAEAGSDPSDLKLEHGAFRANGFFRMVEALKARGERFRVLFLPNFPVVQINIWDPDGNHLHVDFHSDEAAGYVVD